MISTPFSLELTKNEDAISAVAGAVVSVVPTKMKIFLGANVIAGSTQVYVGSLRAIYRHMMNQRFKRVAGSGASVGFGDWQAAGAANITIASGTGSVTADDVALVVAGNFEIEAATHFYTETFDQLIDGLLERAKAN